MAGLFEWLKTPEQSLFEKVQGSIANNYPDWKTFISPVNYTSSGFTPSAKLGFLTGLIQNMDNLWGNQNIPVIDLSGIGVSEEEKKKASSSALKSILGTVLAGALAKAITGSDTFAAGLTKGGLLTGLQTLQELQEKEEQARELQKTLLTKQLDWIKEYMDQKNKFTTELALWAFKEIPKTLEDEEEKKKWQNFAELLEPAYQSSIDKTGRFDPSIFGLKATYLAMNLGLDPQKIANVLNTVKQIADKKFEALKLGETGYIWDPYTGEVIKQLEGTPEIKAERAGDTLFLYNPRTGEIIRKVQGVETPTTATIIHKKVGEEDEEDKKLAQKITEWQLRDPSNFGKDPYQLYLKNLQEIKSAKQNKSSKNTQQKPRSVFDIIK